MEEYTRKFDRVSKNAEMREMLSKVYEALKIKGYDPITQIVGYLVSDDPTYITNYNGARSLVSVLDRDELLEELVKSYLENH